MGWLFGWGSRKDLVKHLIEGNGVKTLKHCSVGTNLWCVHETMTTMAGYGGNVRWACLYLIKGPPYGRDDRHGWGYKDVDETMGPSEITFPCSWLELLTPTTSEHALEWRVRVKARGEKIKRMVLNSRWSSLHGRIYTVIKRRSPTAFRVKDDYGDTYRAGLNFMLSLEEVK